MAAQQASTTLVDRETAPIYIVFRTVRLVDIAGNAFPAHPIRFA